MSSRLTEPQFLQGGGSEGRGFHPKARRHQIAISLLLLRSPREMPRNLEVAEAPTPRLVLQAIRRPQHGLPEIWSVFRIRCVVGELCRGAFERGARAPSSPISRHWAARDAPVRDSAARCAHNALRTRLDTPRTCFCSTHALSAHAGGRWRLLVSLPIGQGAALERHSR